MKIIAADLLVALLVTLFPSDSIAGVIRDDKHQVEEKTEQLKGDGEKSKESELLPNFHGDLRRTKRSNDVTLWENDKIPYQFSDWFSWWERPYILRMMEEIEESTCQQFVLWDEDDDTDHLYFRNRDDGCYADGNGRDPGSFQIVNLASGGCINDHSIRHEIGHALGLDHEHLRPDRDKYVEIYLDNVASGHEHNFETVDWVDTRFDDEPYDFESIMHYTSTAFSWNWKTTIQPLYYYSHYYWSMGRGPRLSDNDIRKINILYDCN